MCNKAGCTHVDKWPIRHIRMDEETYQATREAAKSTGHGSINRLLRAMFVPRPDDPLAEVRAKEEAAESKMFAAFEERERRIGTITGADFHDLKYEPDQ